MKKGFGHERIYIFASVSVLSGCVGEIYILKYTAG